MPLRWWEICTARETNPFGALCSISTTAVPSVELTGNLCNAPLDTWASRSFASPKVLKCLPLSVWRLPEEWIFTIGNAHHLRVDRVVKGFTMCCGRQRLSGGCFGGPIPYDLVFGLDWMTEHKVAWYFHSGKLRTHVNSRWCAHRPSSFVAIYCSWP